MERALIVGRFQPFHAGHLAVVEHVIGQGYVPLIAVGSAQAHDTFHNPFTAHERKRMVEAALTRLPALGLPIDVIPLEDLFDPPRWAAMALERLPSFALVFSNDHVTIEAFEGHGVKVRNIPHQQRVRWQGSVIREQMANGDPAWREAVPDEVVHILDQLGAVKRLAELRNMETHHRDTESTETNTEKGHNPTESTDDTSMGSRSAKES